MAEHSFQVIEQPKENTYDHGYSVEQVVKIKEEKQKIESRDLRENPVTLTEFKEIIVPWNRIHRVEAFNLNTVAKKVTKAKKATVTKPKRMTKKAIAAKLEEIALKQLQDIALTEEETAFYDEQVQQYKDTLV